LECVDHVHNKKLTVVHVANCQYLCESIDETQQSHETIADSKSAFDCPGVSNRPDEPPTALTATFLKNKGKNDQWNAFLTRIAWSGDKRDLKEIGEVISKFLLPIIEQARTDSQAEWAWAPVGPWTPADHRQG